jgi:exodeoxyribonuclease VII large subunit
VAVDCIAARAELAGSAVRLRDHGRRAVITRARALAQVARAPAQHVARNRRTLHQLLRELRASSRRAVARGHERARTQALVLQRGAVRTHGPDRARRASELDRLVLALAAHDPRRTLARGYALVTDRDGTPLGSAGAAREARRLAVRFHDGSVPARVDEEPAP